jgi:hypothetical protein
MDEIKTAAESLRNLVDDSIAVEFNFDEKLNYEELLHGEETFQSTLKTLILALIDFKNALNEANQGAGTIKTNHIDEEVQRVFGLTIGMRIANPILEMHNLSTKASPSHIRDKIEAIFHAFHIDLPSEESKDSSASKVELNYHQLIAVLDLTGYETTLIQNVLESFSSLESTIADSEQDINSLRAGSTQTFQTLNPFLNPTIAYIIQLADKINANANEDEDGHRNSDASSVDSQFDLDRADDSFDFVLEALQKLSEAKEAHVAGDISTAIGILTDDVLDVLYADDAEANPDEDIVVPVHLKVSLLLER